MLWMATRCDGEIISLSLYFYRGQGLCWVGFVLSVRKKGGVIRHGLYRHYWSAHGNYKRWIMGHQCVDLPRIRAKEIYCIDLILNKKNKKKKTRTNVMSSQCEKMRGSTLSSRQFHTFVLLEDIFQIKLSSSREWVLWSQLLPLTKHEGWHITNTVNMPFFLLSPKS